MQHGSCAIGTIWVAAEPELPEQRAPMQPPVSEQPLVPELSLVSLWPPAHRAQEPLPASPEQQEQRQAPALQVSPASEELRHRA